MDDSTPIPADSKRCRLCGEVKPLDEFYRYRKTAEARHSDCKVCRNRSVAEWKAANLDHVRARERARIRGDRSAERAAARIRRTTPEGRARTRRYRLKADYGITPEEYDRLVAEQDGLCAICQRPPRGGKTHHDQMLHVDHDHATGEIRGLLCRHCNVAIGFLDEDPKIMVAAIRYVQRVRDGRSQPEANSHQIA